ncbi:MAG: FAD-dependent oxidoreductase [Candidatus Pacearchaeota archaeon]
MKKNIKKEVENYDLIIIGAGIAGLSAAMYGARLGMRILCLGTTSGSEMPVGGMITTTNVLENYPGIERISGIEFANNLRKHAESYDLVKIKEEKVESIEKNEDYFIVKSEKGSYSGKTILFATGSVWKKLDVPGGKEFENKGVAYCAMCDAPLFKKKIVAVVGGSNSAVKYAIILAEYANKVYIIYRKEKLRADAANLKKIENNNKIEIINNANIVKIIGDRSVKAIYLDREFKGSKELKVDGVFVAIGYVPSSELAKKIGVKINEAGEIVIDHKTCETNVKGVYAAGDVVDSQFKQAIGAASGGCRAAFSAYDYIKREK